MKLLHGEGSWFVVKSTECYKNEQHCQTYLKMKFGVRSQDITI